MLVLLALRLQRSLYIYLILQRLKSILNFLLLDLGMHLQVVTFHVKELGLAPSTLVLVSAILLSLAILYISLLIHGFFGAFFDVNAVAHLS